MSTISPQAIRELRERTQAGMSDCKNALTEAEGDLEKAVELILKKGLAKSAKRAGAVASEGEVRAKLGENKQFATMVEVNIQTDFAARSEPFRHFVGEVLAVAEKSQPGSDLNGETLNGKSIREGVIEITAKIGEKVDVRRWSKVSVPSGKKGFAHAYVHLGGKIGVIVAVETESEEATTHAEVLKFADDTAMQIAAMNPIVLRRDQMSADLVAKQREIGEAQLREDPRPKPEAAWPKIVEGKINKWFSDVVLLEQESVVVPGKTIQQLSEIASQAIGSKVSILEFVRYERGEGIEKAPQADFASEVAKMAGG